MKRIATILLTFLWINGYNQSDWKEVYPGIWKQTVGVKESIVYGKEDGAGDLRLGVKLVYDADVLKEEEGFYRSCPGIFSLAPMPGTLGCGTLNLQGH